MAFLANSTFETGSAGWVRMNAANSVTMQRVSDGTARSGSNFLRVSTIEEGGSVCNDTSISFWNDFPGSFELAATRSVGALAYIRAQPGGPNIAGQLKLWSLGLENQPQNNNGTNFTVGSEWTLIACALDGTEFQTVVRNQNRRHPIIRVEFYIWSVNTFLDIDTVILC